MEPSELNAPSAEDAQLKRLLQAASPAVPDHGFSARVMAALPAPAIRRGKLSRFVVAALGAATGAGFATWRGVNWPPLSSLPEWLASEIAGAMAQLLEPRHALALMLTALSLLVAFGAQLRRRLFD